jgi:xanthine dehydrogenase molybdopterin-binding subunit B
LISYFSNITRKGTNIVSTLDIDSATKAPTMNGFSAQRDIRGMWVNDQYRGISMQYVSMSEVEVNMLTGKVEIREVDCVYDIDAPMNPAIDMQQLEGGYIYALGSLLHEERLYDSSVKLLNDDTWEYKPACIVDAPENMNFSFLQNVDTSRNPLDIEYYPFGSKPAQEMGAVMVSGTFAAIKSAIRSFRMDNSFDAKFEMYVPAVTNVIQSAAGLNPTNIPSKLTIIS